MHICVTKGFHIQDCFTTLDGTLVIMRGQHNVMYSRSYSDGVMGQLIYLLNSRLSLKHV